MRELRSPGFVAAHPVVQAAWAHYAFVAVHPFADGNGRVARALASVFLHRRPGVPLAIFADQKDAYLDGLEETDQGRPERFVRFVQERVADVVGLVQVSARPADRPAAGSTDPFGVDGRITITDLHRLARVLRGQVEDAVRGRLAATDLPGGVEWSLLSLATEPLTVDGVPPAGDPDSVGVLLTRGADSADLWVHVGFSTGDGPGPAFQVHGTGVPALVVQLRELFPTVSSVLRLKLGIWADGVVARVLADLGAGARRAP